MRGRLKNAAGRAAPPIVVGIILGLLGPFGTFQSLDGPARMGYWLSIVVVNWMLCDQAVRRADAWMGAKRHLPPMLIPLLGSFVAAIPATAVVYTAGALAGLPPESPLTLFWKVLLICAVLSVTFYLKGTSPAGREAHRVTASPAAASQPPTDSPEPGTLFFQRLPKPLQGKLLCLQMQDHYLSVHSMGCEQLILCRMEDAARELDGLGRRVHRSWWVADGAIEAVQRHNGRFSLQLVDGRKVPVGRTYQASISYLPTP